MVEQSKKPQLDILLPVHGRLDLTRRSIAAIYSNTKTPFHLIVLDDTDASIKWGSYHQVDPTDVTSQYLKTVADKQKNITYVNREKPYQTGNEFFNEGFEYCQTDFVATVMNSTMVDVEWEKVALELMQKDPQIGCIGFKNLYPTGTIESAGIEMMQHVPIDVGRDEPGHHHTCVRNSTAVQWAFALVRKSAAQGNIYNDMYGFVGWDDIDNCFALRDKGWKVLYCGFGAGTHYPRSTRGSDTLESHRRNQHNARIFWRRWNFWNKYQESIKMDVRYKLSENTKKQLTQAYYQFQVLRNLMNQTEQALTQLNEIALKECGVDPSQYTIEMNPPGDEWNLRNRIGDNGSTEFTMNGGKPKQIVQENSKEEVKQEVPMEAN